MSLGPSDFFQSTGQEYEGIVGTSSGRAKARKNEKARGRGWGTEGGRPWTTTPGMLSKNDCPAPPLPTGTAGAAHPVEPSGARRLQVPRLVIGGLSRGAAQEQARGARATRGGQGKGE